MIRKIFPHPILTLILWVIWLLLNNTVAPGHMVLGLVLAILIPWLTSDFWPERIFIRQPVTLFKFIGVVLWDILVANIKVASLILGNSKNLQPAFFTIDLDIDTPMGISLLANTISLTPGTVSCDYLKESHQLLVHALDADDIDEIILEIKQRYEQPLIKVFTSC